MNTTGAPLFSGLGAGVSRNRTGSFISGFVLQAAFVTVVVIWAVTAPQFITTQVSHIELIAPALDLTPPHSTPTPPEKPVILKETIAPKEAPALVLQKPMRVKPIPQPEVQQVAPPTPKYESKVLNELPGPKAPVKVVTATNFGGSSAAPTLDKVAASKVQTGGFGDPNGVPLNANGHGKANIAAVGSFDLPHGAGYGNGTGGANGARGTVASAGFGNGTAVQGNGGRGGNAGQGRVQTTAFTQAPAASAPRTDQVKAVPSWVPVSIQSKPNPVYTAEARQRRIEGEVLINVVFTAEGKVRVVNVVRGLGFGLDEAAERAVQGLKFNPAQRDGHAVDSTATLHVVFQLS